MAGDGTAILTCGMAGATPDAEGKGAFMPAI
jgi:hypothetical protein